MQQRQLQCPTRRPLYTYRVTAEEYRDLETVLRECLSRHLKLFTLGDVANQLPFFPALFVLYAAEWWRRNYDGTGFSWDPILQAIVAPSDGWTQVQRSDCISRGFRTWELRLSNSRGLRFLGSVAFQGGLPMQLLATARGKIGQALSQVLHLASFTTPDTQEILEWVKNRASYLPKSYRQTEVFVLLTEVVVTVLQLKQSANLVNAENALIKLDHAVPQWRDLFPLPVEDTQVAGLIEQLIRDVAGQAVRNIQHISVERSLEQILPEQWSLRMDIVLPEYLDATALGNLFALDPQHLTRTPTLRFLRGEKYTDVSLRKLAGYERYRIERHPLESRDLVAAGEQVMMLLTSTGESQHKEISRGVALESESPWIFEVITDPSLIYRLFKQGSGSVSCVHAMVSIPSQWTISADDESAVEWKGCILSLDRAIYLICGSVKIEGDDGSIYRVRTGQATAGAELYELRGSRIWETFSQPDRAYKGPPQLYRVADQGLQQAVQGPIGWRIQGNPITTAPERLLGPVTAVWPSQGEPKWRSRLVLLPNQYALQIIPGADINRGTIRFLQSGINSIQCETLGVSTTRQVDGTNFTVEFCYQGDSYPPEWVELSAEWKGNPGRAKIKVPFPAQGIRAFDVNGQQINNGELLTVDEANKVRLITFFGEGAQRADLRLALHHGNHAHPGTEKSYSIRANTGQARAEIRLLDYSNEIRRMLAGADHLDAYVSVRMGLGANTLTLRVARFSLEFEKNSGRSEVGLRQEQNRCLTIEELKTIVVCSVRINAPGEEPVTLQPSESEGVLTGNWLFPASDLPQGPWLIYPGSDSKRSFRPILWPVQSPTTSTSPTPTPEDADTEHTDPVDSETALSLIDSLDIQNERKRANALFANIERLAHNFIDEEWGLVEQMAGTLGHLPLSTLDFWRIITQSPAGMAALALRLGNLPLNFEDRFPTELPFVWETIPITAWVGAIKALKEQGENWYGADGGNHVMSSHLDRRIQMLSSSCPSLRFMLEASRAIATELISRELQAITHPAVGRIYADQLFNGENSRVQKLLQFNAEAPNWPRGFGDFVLAVKNNGYNEFFCPQDFGFHNDVINAPIFLALNCICMPPIEFKDPNNAIEVIRSIQSFDPDWFAEAFDLTIARCIASGTIKLTTE